MTAAELIMVRPEDLTERELFILLADCVYEARLKNGARLTDVIDFREWLLELASASAIERSIRDS